MAFFNAYCDESGKSDDHPVVSFSCIYLPESKLAAFDEDWRKLLRQIEKPCLHMARATRLKENYGPTMPRGQTFRERAAALKPFADCINQHFDAGIGIALEVKGFETWSERALKPTGNPDDPFFVSFMRGLLWLTGRLQSDDRLTLVCDHDFETAWDCYRFYCSMRNTDDLMKQRTICIAFADDLYFPALQAADMLAFLFRLHARHEIYGDYNQWGHLFDDLATTRGALTTQWYFHVGNVKKLSELGMALESARMPKEAIKNEKRRIRKIQNRRGRTT